MHITLTTAGETVHVHPFGERCPDHADAPSPFADEWSVLAFLHRHFGDAADMARLRTALTPEIIGLERLTDADVIAAAAWRLGSGAWQVCRQVRRTAVEAGARAPAASSAPPPAPTPARTPAPAAARAPAPAAAVAPAPAEWPEAADQVAQAQTLEQAARNGTPFCAICEQRRRERERAAVAA